MCPSFLLIKRVQLAYCWAWTCALEELSYRCSMWIWIRAQWDQSRVATMTEINVEQIKILIGDNSSICSDPHTTAISTGSREREASLSLTVGPACPRRRLRARSGTAQWSGLEQKSKCMKEAFSCLPEWCGERTARLQPGWTWYLLTHVCDIKREHTESETA